MQKEFSVQSSHHNKTISFDYRASNKLAPLIIFLHGFKGFKDWGHFNLIADEFFKNGFNVIKINFSHNGTSPEHLVDFVDLEAFGQNNFSIELQDIDDILNYIFKKDSLHQTIDLNNIHLVGHSRGGSTALIKAQKDNRVKSVTTWGSPLDVITRYGTEDKDWQSKNIKYFHNGRTKQDMPLYYQLVEDVQKNKKLYNIYNFLKTTNTKTLIIHSKEDTTVTWEETQLLPKNSDIQIAIIDKGSHTFDGVHPYNTDELPKATQTVIEKTVAFIKK